MSFYQQGRNDGNFDTGIERALQRILADPEFVFRKEAEPPNLATGQTYRISDLELASRLSFFLWSSIPDDELINLAAENKLHEPAVLEEQVHRMLADPRSDRLVINFAGQWLNLRALADLVAHGFDLSRFRRQPARWRCAKRPSCSSAASCMRIAACSIFWMPSTRS